MGYIDRRYLNRAVGSTLLVKGLEFNHTIILNAGSLNKKNLYVAMTRGTDTLTILSEDRFLSPKTSNIEAK